MIDFCIQRCDTDYTYLVEAEDERQAIEIWLEEFWNPSWGINFSCRIFTENDFYMTTTQIDVCDFWRRDINRTRPRYTNTKLDWINGF